MIAQKAALNALAELSRKTQVLFFTHHHHLIELAQARFLAISSSPMSCPDFRRLGPDQREDVRWIAGFRRSIVQSVQV